MTDRLLNSQQLAKMLGVHVDYLNKMRDIWQLPYIRVSRKTIRYSEAQVNMWLAARAQKKEKTK